MKLIAPLLQMRWQHTRNQFLYQTGTKRTALMLGLPFFIITLVLFGHLAAPSLMNPPIDIATPRGLLPEQLPAGSGAMEVAFWLTSLLLALLSFRVMELLFRRNDIRAVEYYPIDLPTLYLDRCLAIFAEGLVVAFFASMFFVPLIWHGGAHVMILCSALLAVGLFVGQILAFAVYMFMGVSQLSPSTPTTDQHSSSRDLYGGSGQAFIYAPGLSLALGVVHVLFAKLVLSEFLRAATFTVAMRYGLLIIAALATVSVILSYRYFVQSFFRVAARFREADFVGFDTYAQYQKSAFTTRSAFERILSKPQTFAFFRMIALQYARRYMLSRYGYGLIWAGSALAAWQLSPQAFPQWAIVMLPTFMLTFFANPWYRLETSIFNPHTTLALPVSLSDETQAKTTFILREILIFSVPYIVLVGLGRTLGGYPLIETFVVVGMALAIPLAIHGAFSLVLRRSDSPPIPLWMLVPALSLVFLALVIYSILIAALLAIALIPLLYIAWKPHGHTQLTSV